MKTILRERTVKFNFKGVEQRSFFLERMLAEVNNNLLAPDLKPMDRSRYYNILISGTKLIHEMEVDPSVEELDERLREIEEEYARLKRKNLEGNYF